MPKTKKTKDVASVVLALAEKGAMLDNDAWAAADTLRTGILNARKATEVFETDKVLVLGQFGTVRKTRKPRTPKAETTPSLKKQIEDGRKAAAKVRPPSKPKPAARPSATKKKAPTAEDIAD